MCYDRGAKKQSAISEGSAADCHSGEGRTPAGAPYFYALGKITLLLGFEVSMLQNVKPGTLVET